MSDDFTRDWPPDLLRKALRTAEDALARNLGATAQFAQEADRIVTELWRIAVETSPLPSANLRRHAEAEALRAEWQRLRDAGLSGGQVATRYKVDPTQVYRKTHRKKP